MTNMCYDCVETRIKYIMTTETSYHKEMLHAEANEHAIAEPSTIFNEQEEMAFRTIEQNVQRSKNVLNFIRLFTQQLQ